MWRLFDTRGLNSDGSAPPPHRCACGCVEGDVFSSGVCTAAGCLIEPERVESHADDSDAGSKR